MKTNSYTPRMNGYALSARLHYYIPTAARTTYGLLANQEFELVGKTLKCDAAVGPSLFMRVKLAVWCNFFCVCTI